MHVEASPDRRGRRLLQAGILLFLAALIVGLAVPRFTVPRLALSTHLLGITQGLFLMVLGLIWPKLGLNERQSLAGAALAIYGCVAAWAANLLGAVWGAGSTMVPIAAGGARGSEVQEMVIRVLLISAALSLIAATAVTLWGLRTFGAAAGSTAGVRT